MLFIGFSYKKYLRNSPKSLDTLHVTPRTPYNKDQNLTTVKMRLSFVHKIGYIF